MAFLENTKVEQIWPTLRYYYGIQGEELRKIMKKMRVSVSLSKVEQGLPLVDVIVEFIFKLTCSNISNTSLSPVLQRQCCIYHELQKLTATEHSFAPHLVIYCGDKGALKDLKFCGLLCYKMLFLKQWICRLRLLRRVALGNLKRWVSISVDAKSCQSFQG